MTQETMTHPIIIERNKYDAQGLYTDANKMEKTYEEYEEQQMKFNEFCQNMLLDLGNKKDLFNKNQFSKLRKKLKRQSLDISLEGFQNVPEWKDIQPLLVKHEEYRIRCQETFVLLSEVLKQAEFSNREELKKFLIKNQEIQQMLYLTNQELYKNTQKYLNGEFEGKKKKLRKVEIPLMKVVSKATTKTSPNFYFNTVKFYSDQIKEFDYQVKKNQITPNYVFFHRALEYLLLSEEYLEYAQFKINNRITKMSDDGLYIFKNESDNYKIFKSKDVLHKSESNEVIEVLLQHPDQLFATSYFCETFDMTVERAKTVVKKLHDLGVLELNQQLTDHIDIIQEFSKTMTAIFGQNSASIDQVIDSSLTLRTLFEKINEGFSIDKYNQIISNYESLSALIGIEVPSRQLLVYGDNVISNDQATDSPDILSEHMEELLSVFPIFDINEKIKNEFAVEVEKYKENELIEMNHPAILKVLTDVNLKYGQYWANPWHHFETNSSLNKFLFGLQNELVEYLTEHIDEKNVLDLTKKLMELSLKLKKKEIQREGHYSVFYQNDEQKQTIINKIYPGYGSFYQRFLRYTNILESYSNEVKDFYQSNHHEIAELHEPLAFNANVVDIPYYETRYMDGLSKVNGEKDIFQKHIYEERSNLEFEDGDFVLQYDGKKYKPVISSSLIRALYPGKFAFITSIFSNISFINDLSLFWINQRKDQLAIRSPQMKFKDIVLERGHLYCKAEYFKNDSNNTEEHLYLSIREKLGSHGIGSSFFIQSRKKQFVTDQVNSISFEFNKPQYIDLNNVLLYKLFLNTVKTNEDLLISEILPENISASEYMKEVKVINGEDS
ncbi:TPA: hypothetical protein IUT69_002018 [Enterococcus faecalis]|nr:hypothetical protein [Enterococcus faecalis]